MTTEIFNEKSAAPSLQIPTAVGSLVTITAKAAEKATALLSEKGQSEASLRVFVVGGGCSGYQYGMAIAEAPEADDMVIEENGVRILVDKDSQSLINGAEIDYTDDLMKSGFTIFNPTAVSSCACGSSFQTADGSGSPAAC